MLAPDDPRHGTFNGYCNLKCRCAPCREAWRIYYTAYRRADPERLARHAKSMRNLRAQRKGKVNQ